MNFNADISTLFKKEGKEEKEEKSPIKFGSTPFADLLPPLEREKKEKREVISRWTSYASLSALIAVFASLGSWGMAYMASQSYEFQLSEERRIDAMLEEYEDIATMFSDRNRLNNDSQRAMTTEIAWFDLLGDVQNNLPNGSSLTNFTIAGGQPESPESLDVDALAEYLTEEEIAKLVAEAEASGDQKAIVVLITVESPNPLDYAEIASAIPGTSDSQLGNINNDGDGNYSYTVVFGFDEDTFVDRYNLREDAEEEEN